MSTACAMPSTLDPHRHMAGGGCWLSTSVSMRHALNLNPHRYMVAQVLRALALCT